MKIPKLKLYTGFICVALFIPNLSFAYLTTDQTAHRINDNTFLYTISYRFGSTDRELYMPIGATRNNGEANEYLNYNILNGDLKTNIGTSSSIVLTTDEDVRIKGAEYHIPRGKDAVFTLVTLLRVDESEINEVANFSKIVSSLPFKMVGNDKTIDGHLNPSELQYYRTPSIKY